MRITIVLGPFLPVPPVLGGAVEKAQFALAQAYRDAGHEVVVISRRYEDFPIEENAGGIHHIRVASFGRSDSRVENLAKDFCYAMRVARRLPASDITVTNSFSLPLVLPRKNAGKIYMHVARFPKHQMGLYRRADRLQAISRAVADAIIAQTPAMANRVVAIGYPLPNEYFASAAGPSRGNTVLYVGRIAREKGLEHLLTAFAMLDKPRGWTLRIVGPHAVEQGGSGAEYLARLRDLARSLGLACDFAGPVFDEQALIREYRAAAVFVYPSLAERGEAFGLAALEAMASGCATVVSDLRCFDDFIDPELSGLAFDHRGTNAASALAAQLRRLIDVPDLRARVAEAGQRAAGAFRISAIAARMLDDFDSLLTLDRRRAAS